MVVPRSDCKASMPERLAGAVAALDEVICRREDKLRRVSCEREQAVKRYEDDLRAIAARKPNPSGRRKERQSLEKEERSLVASIAELEKKEADSAQSVSELTAIVSQLKEKKCCLADAVADRSLLTRICKILFGDTEASEMASLEKRILAGDMKIVELESSLERVVQEGKRLREKQARLQARLGLVRKALRKQREELDVFAKEYRAAEKQNPAKGGRFRARRSKVKEAAEAEWQTSLARLSRLVQRIRERQPRLDKLEAGGLQLPAAVPPALAVDRVELSYGDWCDYIPRLVPFPLDRACTLPMDVPEGADFIHRLLLRMLTALPAGSLRITVCDPLGLGESLGPFLPFPKGKGFFVGDRTLTRGNEIEAALQGEIEYVESTMQKRLVDGIGSWGEFNRKNPDTPLSYRVLLMFAVPEQVSDRSLHYLCRLVEHGPRCGVLPVMTTGQMPDTERRYRAFRVAIGEWCDRLDAIEPFPECSVSLYHVVADASVGAWPSEDELPRILGRTAELYDRARGQIGGIEALWEDTTPWQEKTVDGIDAPVGWDADGEIVRFQVGQASSEHHALLAGRSGMGKSNFLHVLVHSLCHRYSPSELDLYLLDYKQGTELSVYAKPCLPHACLVATESDPEYGVTVLAHLLEELERRAAMFKQYTVRDVPEFRALSETDLPRVLLIVDEFQLLFSEGRGVAEPAEKMLTKLLRQGRAYGIHVLLSTQTLKGIQSVSMGQLTSQVGLRVCLACSEEDSAVILGSSNWAGAELSGPPEAIINDSNGAKSGNRKFSVPLADRTHCTGHLSFMAAAAEEAGFRPRTRIFNGAHLPPFPLVEDFTAESCVEGSVRLLFGEKLSFEADRFVCELRPKPGGNLLCAGQDPKIQEGLLRSALTGLAENPSIQHVVFFDARGEHRHMAASIPGSLQESGRFCVVPEDWDADLDALPSLEPGKFGVLLVDGLDSARVLHGKGVAFTPRTSGAPASPALVFREFIDTGPKRGWFTVAFSDSWRRTESVFDRQFLFAFQLRVGFGLAEDEAGAFVSGSVAMKLKGLAESNRGVFSDLFRNTTTWFRPFVDVEGIS